MSERTSGANDPLNELIAGLSADTEFSDAMHSLAAQMSAVGHDRARLPDLDRPYYESSLADFLHTFHTEFLHLCNEYGIDCSSPHIPPEEYSVLETLIRHFFSLHSHELAGGDTIVAEQAVLVEPVQREGWRRAALLSPGERIVGKFVSPVVGDLPDDAAIMLSMGRNDSSLGESEESEISTGLGIGLALRSACILDEAGEGYANEFANNIIVVPIGTLGLTVHKINYRPE